MCATKKELLEDRFEIFYKYGMYYCSLFSVYCL
jgi:hypothetical protein